MTNGMNDINLDGVETGRTQSDEPNVPNTPKEKISAEEFGANLVREREEKVISLLRKVAEEQLLLERYKIQRDALYEALANHNPEFQEYLNTKDIIKSAETSIDSLKDEIRVDALKGYDVEDEERNKKPYDGIVIKDYKKIEYNAVQAITWAKENMPVALKTTLDKSTFEKFAKSNPEEESLSFVKFRTEPMATISQDLSQYLPKEDEKELFRIDATNTKLMPRTENPSITLHILEGKDESTR